MSQHSDVPRAMTGPGGVGRDVLLFVVLGAVVGLAYNYLGLQAQRPWGLSWIARDSVAELAAGPTVSADAPVPDGGYATDVTDPRAVFGETSPAADLPEIPALNRPVQIDLGALKRYVDADAAVLLDAREPYEWEESRIPGALSFPYDRAASDPTLVESLDTGGRPIITYCGGGSCELSVSLANELIFAGHQRVAVYVGGFPEWVEAGYPVEAGTGKAGD